MKGWQMYSTIQAMKAQGFTIRQVAKIRRASRNTVAKYWDMKPEEYAEKYKSVNRQTELRAYEPVVLKWLETYPSMSAAQVRDWLCENYKVDANDRTVRSFVADIRERSGIKKQSKPRRTYEAVDEMPKGYQLQLDFGEKTARYAYSARYIKLHFVVFTLSHSRYKWGMFQVHPFTAANLVNAMYRCFEYMGGTPKQLVYDLDSIIVANENGGDIIHTQAFTAFLAETKLDVRPCRKSDPESKGKIEAAVKFVKGNFMENRLYTDIEAWNESFERWLERTGNGQKHGTTKRKPAEMFLEEQEHLLPLFGTPPTQGHEIHNRTVRQDNTILYLSNRYSVPLGTYGKEKEVCISVDGNTLEIMDKAGEIIGLHEINEGKGKLIKSDVHRRNRSEKIQELLDKTVALLGIEFHEYLSRLCKEKPRYVKEQMGIITQACEDYGRERVLESVEYCRTLELYSANDLRSAVESMHGQAKPKPEAVRLPVDDERYHISVQKRSLSAYVDIASGSGGVVI